MALSAQQQQMANLIYGIARQNGLNDARAREMVAAAYAESGLNPTIRNKSSGATGLFQLLSSGYVNAANRMGGAANPRANIMAILPSYKAYWAKHPNAAPGAAGRDVELSGEGASFYSSPLSQLGALKGSPAPIPGSSPGSLGVSAYPPNVTGQPSIGGPRDPVNPSESTHPFSDFALSLLGAFKANSPEAMLGAITSLRNNLRPEPVSQPTLGGGQFPGMKPTKTNPNVGPKMMGGSGLKSTSYTGAGNDVNMMLAAQAYARKMGMHMSENYDLPGGVNPVHVKDSYHYRRYATDQKLGRAMDVTGTPQQMAGFYRYMSRTNPTELFYDPLGGMKYGKNIGAIGGHQTHVHIAY